jgi:hypothetical protein
MEVLQCRVHFLDGRNQRVDGFERPGIANALRAKRFCSADLLGGADRSPPFQFLRPEEQVPDEDAVPLRDGTF